MIFFVENEVNAEFDFDMEELASKVAKAVLDEEGLKKEAEINLIITDNEGIRQMNSRFRDIDRPTDVLSFPNISFEAPGDFAVIDGEQSIDVINPDSGNVCLGDIVINDARVRSQAAEYGHSRMREFAFLVAHSMLHLCGYDHIKEDEAAVMEKKQNDILNSLGITRTSGS